MPKCACLCGGTLKSKRKDRPSKFLRGHHTRVAPKDPGKAWHQGWWYERRGVEA